MKLDLLLCMNQKSCDDYYMDLKPEGILLADATFVTQLPIPRAYAIPFTRIAREKLGSELTANIVALGTVSQITPIVSPKSLEKALLNRIPQGSEASTRQALRAGINAAKQVLKKIPNLLPYSIMEEEP